MSRPATNISVYTRHYTATGAAGQYARKFVSPLEHIRHRHEVELLAPFATGEVFDCSIAIGRFIGALPRARSYAGMDFSTEFLAYIRRRYPDADVTQGDLREGIARADNRYDATLCLRTLSALGHVQDIVAEMARITRRDGLVIFDYGTRATEGVMKGERLALDSEDPEAAMRNAGLEPVARLRLDGLIVRIKRFPRLFRLLNRFETGSLVWRFLLWTERLSTRIWHDRVLYIARVRE